MYSTGEGVISGKRVPDIVVPGVVSIGYGVAGTRYPASPGAGVGVVVVVLPPSVSAAVGVAFAPLIPPVEAALPPCAPEPAFLSGGEMHPERHIMATMTSMQIIPVLVPVIRGGCFSSLYIDYSG